MAGIATAPHPIERARRGMCLRGPAVRPPAANRFRQNPADTERCRSSARRRPRAPWRPAHRSITSVGRLERYKGHHRLIAAMPALLETAPGARLAIVGRGRYEKALRHLTIRLGVERAVLFTSFESDERAALGALIRTSDIVALMSEYEANPVALMEALALGRKVVVADTSGLTELATDGLATSVPLHASPAALARVLLSVAAAPEPDSPPLPTWDHCVDDLLCLYADTVSNPR